MPELSPHPALLPSTDLPGRWRTPGEANRLLANLPEEDARRLAQHLAPVTFAAGKTLVDPERDATHAWFPLRGVVAMQYGARNGASIAVALVGNEGVLGLGLFLGDPGPLSAVAITGGLALRLPAAVVERERATGSELFRRALRYAQALTTQMGQLALCHRRHVLPEQLARWLLLAFDRHDADVLRVTHEEISDWMGVRREGVTQALGHLQALGGIALSRGQVRLVSRQRLASCACECYAALRDEYSRLLPGEGPE